MILKPMRQLILLIAVSLISLTPIFSQTVQIDALNWSSQTPGATSGLTDKGNPWFADGNDQDATGTFGVTTNVFAFEDTEGSQSCPCVPGDPSPSCGNNDNTLVVGPIPVTSYCEATVSFDIILRGDLKCGTANDQSAADVTVEECPSDNGDQWAGTDALEVRILNTETGEEKTTLICGSFSTETFSISETFNVGGDGTAIVVFITGGTQSDGGSYDIGTINLEGLPRSNSSVNLQIEGGPAGNIVCEGEGSFKLITAANPNSDYFWAFPDGTTTQGNINNGNHNIIFNNIDPTLSGTYKVTVVDDNNCELYDEIDVSVVASTDASCQGTVRFVNLSGIQCSDVVLPNQDDNGILGTWTPGNVLQDYAGQTLNFTFTPDDANVASDNFLLTIDDLSLFPLFGTIPDENPVLCNAAGVTYDFIQMFGLNYQDYRLEVSGDLDLFDFIPTGSLAFVDAFEGEFRRISVEGETPRENVGFSITGYTDCGAPPITKSFFVDIEAPEEPIVVDTTLCSGDFILFEGIEIYRDTVIRGEDACGSNFRATINRLEPQISTRFYPGRGLSCGEAYYYYDTIVNGMNVGWIKGNLIDGPPFGTNYDTILTETASGLYTLPIPASNGCDSIQMISLNVTGVANITEMAFDLCSNKDSVVAVGSATFRFDKDNTEMYIPTGGCDFIHIVATILDAESDTIPTSVHCMGEVVPLEIAPGRVMNFDDSMTYPFTVDLDEGNNGCAATVTVDLVFQEVPRSELTRRLCPGETFQVGNTTVSGALVDEEIIILGGASNGCDSIVVANVSMIEPTTIPVNDMICEGESVIEQGETFDINNPSGLIRIPSSLGCDSLIYDVQISFFEVQDTTINATICPGDEIELPEYGFTIDQDNLEADLQTTTTDGCTQNVYIRAEIGGAAETTFSRTICNGDAFNFAGIDRLVSGTYSELISRPDGCDSISTLELTVLRPIPVTDGGQVQGCTGVPLEYLNHTYDVAGRYRDTVPSIDGCDSIVTFTVSFTPLPTTDAGIFFTCPGTPFTFANQEYTVEDSYEVLLIATDGCDSLVSFELEYFEIPTTDLGVLETCPAVAIEYNGNSYPDEGDYSETFTSSDGCDSIVSFTVAFTEIPRTDIGIINTCPDEGVEVLGNTYTDENVYEVTLQTDAGCDSIVAFEVVYFEIPTTDIGVLETCPGVAIDFAGNSYPDEGDYSETFTSSDGCDSIVTFSVAYTEIPMIDLGTFETCPNVAVEYNGNSYPDEGVFSETFTSSKGCDSIVSFSVIYSEVPRTDIGIINTCPGQSIDRFNNTYTDEGAYDVILQTPQGCDSIVIFEVVFFETPETNIGEFSTCPGVAFEMFDQSFATEGPHSVTLVSADGCDSTLSFNLIFEEPTPEELEETICSGESFSVFNQSFSTSVDEMIVGAGLGQGGCDSTVHLVLTVLEPESSSETHQICDGASVTIGDRTFDRAVQDEPVIFTNRNNCDSTVLVTVEVLQDVVVDLGEVAICPDASYQVGTTTITDDGPHSILLETSAGCDSTITLTITRISPIETSEDHEICFGSSINVNGQSYDQAGAFAETLTSQVTGCDSIHTINITMLEEIQPTYLPIESVCFGEIFEYEGFTIDTEGEHEFATTTASGCDSVVIVTLEIGEEIATEIFETTCETAPFSYEGETYTTTGRYDVTLVAADGCDSVVTLDLTVVPSIVNDLGDLQMCNGQSITMGDFTLDEERQYTLAFTTDSGCDSTVMVNVVFVDAITVDLGTLTICEGDAYDFGGEQITESGTYRDTSLTANLCDSIATIEINVLPEMEIVVQDLIGSCEGGANGSFVIGDIPGATPPFSVFGLEGVTTITSLPFAVTGLALGDYSFDLTDANGCMSFGQVSITDDRDNALSITSITVDPAGEYELILNYSGDIASIEWADVPGLSCYDCPNPTVLIEETTTFSVTVIDAEGCVSTAEITLEVDGIGSVYFPNIISPNSAIGNHRFFPQTEPGNEATYDIYIFDRWGNKVYEMRGGLVNDITFGWNGRYSDNRINAGVFVYSVRIYKDNGAVKTFKGDVTVVE